MFKQLQSKGKVEFVDEDPYENDEEMRQDVLQNKILKVFTGGTEHPIFDPELNVKLRAVHDWMAHLQPSGFSGTGFDMKGEIQAYNTHLKTIPPAGAPARSRPACPTRPGRGHRQSLGSPVPPAPARLTPCPSSRR